MIDFYMLALIANAVGLCAAFYMGYTVGFDSGREVKK